MSRLIVPAEWRNQPWKNGAGITREIVRWPTDVDDTDDYTVRVSVAEVTQSGPFSQFPGYRRWSVLLDRSPIELVTGDAIFALDTVGDLIELAGETEIAASLASPAHLLNIFGKPGTRVGVGDPRMAVRFAFALAATGELGRWHARVSDPPQELATGSAMVWIA